MTPPTVKLHVLFRAGTATALVLRQGPSRVFCAVGWSLDTDTFAVGQWCKHKIYPRRCDISPCGTWLSYFALNGDWSSAETRGAWRGLSKVPYLRAVKMWPMGTTWGGGMCFEAGDGVDPDAPMLPSGTHLVSGDSYRRRLLSGGWKSRWTDRWGDKQGLAIELPDGAIWRKSVTSTKERNQLRGPTGEVHAFPHWDWADYDAHRGRVVWAADGRLWAAGASVDQIRTAQTCLHDFRSMTFTAIKAPYA